MLKVVVLRMVCQRVGQTISNTKFEIIPMSVPKTEIYKAGSYQYQPVAVSGKYVILLPTRQKVSFSSSEGWGKQ